MIKFRELIDIERKKIKNHIHLGLNTEIYVDSILRKLSEEGTVLDSTTNKPISEEKIFNLKSLLFGKNPERFNQYFPHEQSIDLYSYIKKYVKICLEDEVYLSEEDNDEDEHDSNNIICPYCDFSFYDGEEYLGECEHFVSCEDDYIDWGDDLSSISEIISIIEEYVYDDKRDQIMKTFNSFLKDLKIGKEIIIDHTWDFFTIENNIECLTNEIFILDRIWDGGGPGLSGTHRILFVRDWDKIKWLIKEFQIFLDRLLEFDKDNKRLFV